MPPSARSPVLLHVCSADSVWEGRGAGRHGRQRDAVGTTDCKNGPFSPLPHPALRPSCLAQPAIVGLQPSWPAATATTRASTTAHPRTPLNPSHSLPPTQPGFFAPCSAPVFFSSRLVSAPHTVAGPRNLLAHGVWHPHSDAAGSRARCRKRGETQTDQSHPLLCRLRRAAGPLPPDPFRRTPGKGLVSAISPAVVGGDPSMLYEFWPVSLLILYTPVSKRHHLRLLWLGRAFFWRRLSLSSRCLRMVSLSRSSLRPLPLPT